MSTLTRNPRKVCNRIGLALFAMLIGYMVASVLLLLAVTFALPDFISSPWGVWSVNDGALYLIGVPIYLVILHFVVPDGPKEERPKPEKRFGIGKYILLLCFCLGATYAFNFISTIIITLIDMVKGAPSTSGLESVAGNSGILPNLIFGAVVPAFGEEFLFRYMLRRKLRGAGDKIYILLSAFAFAMFHGNLNQLFYAFVIGLAFAWVYVRTGHLWIPISLHFILNTLGMVVVPALGSTEIGLLAVGAGVIVLIIAAILIFCLTIRNVLRGLMPPFEPGWPNRPPAGARMYTRVPPPVYSIQPLPGGPVFPYPPPAPSPYGQPPVPQSGAAFQATAPPAFAGQPVVQAHPAAQALPTAQPAAPVQRVAQFTTLAQPAVQQPSPYQPPPVYPYRQPAPTGQPIYPYSQPAQAHMPSTQPQQAYAPPSYARPGYIGGQPMPAYGQPYGSAAYASPPVYPPYAYSAPACAAPPHPSAFKICMGNVGMILYTIGAIGLIVLSLV